MKKRIALTWVAGVLVALPVAWWSFVASVHLEQVDSDAVSLQTEPNNQPEAVGEVHAMNESSFKVRLFNPPPSDDAGATAKRKTNAPPFRLQLIGIVSEDGVHKAALYDPNEDRLFIVTDGERIGSQYEVVSVDVDSVVITEGTRRHRLVLDPAQSKVPTTGKEVAG